MFDAIALEFVGVSSTEDFVAGDLGGNNLADDISIGEADDEAVFGSVIFVLGLGDQTLASIVVGFTRPTALVFGLVPAVV